MRRSLRAAAFGLALTLVCLSAAPAVAAPRVEAPAAGPVLTLDELTHRIADLWGTWFRSFFGATAVTGDPDG